MTNRIREPNKFVPYLEVAQKEGFDNVVVYTPGDLNIEREKVYGYVFEAGRWARKYTAFPSISYDIGYYSVPETIRKVCKIKQCKQIPFIGYGLGNKWMIHQHLSRFPELDPHLIPTTPVSGFSSIRSITDKYETIIIKPVNGKEGKGILRLRRDGTQYCLEENDQPDRYFSKNKANDIVQLLDKNQRYLAQKWIDIRNQEGHVYDIRSLMQKDGSGHWQIAGMAARQGGAGRITSNLMDGGTPFSLDDYLKKQFGKRRAKALREKLQQLSHQICR